MTDPIRTPPARTHTLPQQPPPTAEATGQAREASPILQLIDGVDSPPTTPGRCESPTDAMRRRSVDRALEKLVTGDRAGFDELVRTNPRILGSLGRLSKDALARRIGAAYDRTNTGFIDRHMGGNYFATMRGVGRVVDRVQSAFREMVRNEAKTAVEDLTRRIDTMSPNAIVQSLRDAEPGTPEGDLAHALGIRGDSGDVARVEGHIEAMVQSLRTFREHLIGNTWEPSDFPETTGHVLCRLGMRAAPEGSVLEDAIEGNRPMNDAGHNAVVVADVVVAIYEIAHAVAHPALVTAAPAGIALAGLALGFAIHHAVEENIEGRRELAREIGL